MACLFVNKLSVIDFAYLDSARGLVGDSWIVDIELEGDLDNQSMVLDFGAVKKDIKRIIDDTVDHTLVVPLQADGVQWTTDGRRTHLLFPSSLGAFEHEAPACAVTPLSVPEIDAASIISALESAIRPALPASVHALRLHLRAETIDGASYQYTHGLRKHDGACQRIAHGHRSRVEIHRDGVRAHEVEAAMALRWTDIYLGSQADCVARANGRLRFGYDAPEGRFELALPEHRVELLATDTTVECIATHLLDCVAADNADSRWRVRAFEGVEKGAIAER